MLACLVAAAAGGWLGVLNAVVAVRADTLTVAVEAALFAVAGMGIAVVALRAAWRRRGRAVAPEPDEGGPVAGATSTSDSSDDPLAWARRRRFGAGG